nr:MAG TPA: hypothetical protein [Caudoviricetes sp.]
MRQHQDGSVTFRRMIPVRKTYCIIFGSANQSERLFWCFSYTQN